MIIIKRKIIMSVLVSLACFCFCFQYVNNVTADITGSVVRLHVVANGNSEQEQSLKLKVRDDIIAMLSPTMKNVKNEKDAEYIIFSKLDEIKETAENTLKNNNSEETVNVYFENHSFPLKKYANVTFPSGEYKALRVVLGSGMGENWWCVLFPQLCFSENTYGTLTEEGVGKLKNSLSKDEYELLLNDTKIKFRLVEFIDKMRG